MIFPLVATGVFLLPTAALAVLVGLLRWWRGRAQRRYWRAVLWTHVFLVPLHLFVTFPAVLGWFGSRGLGTRGDERGYTGPRVLADGSWALQSRGSLDAEERGTAQPPRDLDRDAVRSVTIPGAVPLRAFVVAAPVEPPRATAVMVHGLFRSALELEPPAAMLRRAGCEVWLLEQRNHGGSGRAPATFGRDESRDVVRAVEFVRATPGRADVPVVLFGVSLGSVSVALALPHLRAIRGVVLDAPVDDVLSTAHRMLGLQRPGDRRSRFAIDEPVRSLVLAAVQLWSGFRFAQVRPDLALQGLDADFPVLLIAGEDDDKVPVDGVRELLTSLPMRPSVKQLWVVPGAGHGDAWRTAPQAYEAQLRAFLDRALSPE